MALAIDFPERFEREQGCTEAEWLGWLPGAVGPHPLQLDRPGQAEVRISQGALALEWQALPPRRIALLRLPRLQVTYRFAGVDAAARREFMRHFDLYLHRGGG